MADGSMQALRRKPRPSKSFLGLPAEIRFKIYKFVYTEINITCTTRYLPSANPTSPRYICKTTHCIDLLLTSRKVCAEAKPVFDSAPIAVACYLTAKPLIPRDFPQPLLRRIYKLVVEGRDPYFGGFGLAFGTGWFDRKICPNLRIVWRNAPKIQPSSSQGHSFSAGKQSPLEFIPLLLPGSPINPRDYGIANGNTHDLLEVSKSRPAMSIAWRALMDRYNDFIRDHDLIVKSRYAVGLRATAQEMTDCLGPWILFEEWLFVVVVWDKNGIRIDGLPDLRGLVWWKEWADTYQLPPSQQRVIFETCTELPERTVDKGRPWNIVRSSLESA